MDVFNLSIIWPDFLERLREKVHPHIFHTWFSPLKPRALEKNKLSLETPNKFFSGWLKENYATLFSSTLKEMGLDNLEIDFVSFESRETLSTTNLDIKPRRGEEKPRLALNPRYTFEAFVVGPSNRFAHAASLAVAESPAKAYNPLFIYGGVGLGKTHLMQAIGHYSAEKYPQAKITYISSEEFTNQLINSIQKRTMVKFREQYRTVDILLIDDVHFIAGKESTQEEFFHTFNALYDAHKQIVLSSDRSPKEIQGLEERLVSRFGWGLVTDIQAPDFETRTAILRKKAELSHVNVPDEVTIYLAEKITANIRELEGALIRVIAHSTLEGEEISLLTAQKVLRDMIKEEERKVTVETIQKKVAEHFNIRFSDMRTRKRTPTVAFPRQIAMYLVRELTSHSLPEIGMYFGGKDHTTVIHACNKIQQQAQTDKGLQQLLERLVNEIKS